MHIKNVSLCLILLFSVSACSVAKVPTASIATAKLAIDGAKRNNAETYAPLELQLSLDKLRAAEKATKKKDYELAKYLSEQATVDAQVAEAKAEANERWRATAETIHTAEILK